MERAGAHRYAASERRGPSEDQRASAGFGKARARDRAAREQERDRGTQIERGTARVEGDRAGDRLGKVHPLRQDGDTTAANRQRVARDGETDKALELDAAHGLVRTQRDRRKARIAEDRIFSRAWHTREPVGCGAPRGRAAIPQGVRRRRDANRRPDPRAENESLSAAPRVARHAAPSAGADAAECFDQDTRSLNAGT